MNTKAKPLAGLPNLGVTIVSQLHGSGVVSARQLARIGPAAAYVRLCQRAGRRLPLCYYLYSLEGALRGVHWSTLTAADKRRLRVAADEAAARTTRSAHIRVRSK